MKTNIQYKHNVASSFKRNTRILSGATVLILLVFSFIQTSCKKFIAIEPPSTSINSANVYSSDATAAAALTGIYDKMSVENRAITGLTMISIFPGLSADEFSLFSGNLDANKTVSYKNQLTSATNPDIWSSCYSYIYYANAAIIGLNASQSLTPQVKKQLLGEAYFMRAFCYYYLVNLYGDSPLVLTTDYSASASLPRAGKSTIYKQITDDLTLAQSLLNSNYVTGNISTSYPTGQEERVRPNLYTANALLARTSLFTGDYATAETQASSVINAKPLYDTVGVNSVFLKNSKETIWSLQSVGSGNQSNTGEGGFFIPNTSAFPTSTYPVSMSDNFIQLFEPRDKRFTNWLVGITTAGKTSYYPFKYKIRRLTTATSEYSIVFRLAEQYLIRAEARAMLNNLNGALDDLNIIRKRAGLNQYTGLNQGQLLTAILKEKQIEMFSEWGTRWFDLKRTGTVDAVMSIAAPLKGGTWTSSQALYPIPSAEIQRDPNLIQNPGY
jgi:starch-binding outer membrane protein, SusD/RagB family